MIGDTPSTDMLFGKNGGIDTCLVLSGRVRSEADFRENWLPDYPDSTPTYIIEMVGDLEEAQV